MSLDTPRTFGKFGSPHNPNILIAQVAFILYKIYKKVRVGFPINITNGMVAFATITINGLKDT